MKKTKSVLAGAITSILLLPGHALSASQAQTTAISFDIPSQPLVEALRAIASQTQQNVFFDPQIVAGHQAPALRAAMSAEEALVQALSGSGLTYRRIDERTVTIVPVVPTVHTTTSSGAIHQPRSAGWVKTSSLQSAIPADDVRPVKDERNTQVSGSEPDTDAADQQRSTIKLEEVVVTGSHIRGTNNLSSPVVRFDREDIQRSGFSTTQEFVQNLTQNFGNVSDLTVSGFNGGAGANETYFGSGLNLRGLGSDATLVLLNGRRLAPAGKGGFVDLSLVPLAAIERMEVLTDGASAIYGSDAVGGVVNITLRNDFSGAETRVRYGTVTQGEHDELQAGQMLGNAWDGGHVLFGYEYHRQTKLAGRDRDFVDRDVFFDDVELIPGQRRHSALATLEQRLTDNVELSGDFFYSDRESAMSYQYFGLPHAQLTHVRQLGGALGLTADVGREWQVRSTAAFDRSQAQGDGRTFGTIDYEFGNQSRIWSVDVAADGPIMRAPGGHVRLAAGAQFRDERFVEEYIGFPAKLDRQIGALYTEVNVPWVSSYNSVPGIERLELTLAARYEDYSDFGSTFNPKMGLAWAPVDGLNLRGTLGTSFKAPLLDNMNPQAVSVFVYQDRFADASGDLVSGITIGGSNAQLGPEESTNWTLGFDLTPAALPGLSMSATYFDIDYQDRISSPFAHLQFDVLMHPNYSIFVTRDPSPELVAALMAMPTAYCVTASSEDCTATMLPVEQVVALIDQRLTNIAGVRMNGFDVSVGYRLESPVGDWGMQVSGTRTLKNREQLIPGDAESDVLNNVWQPVDLRLRGGVTFTRGALSINTFLNYTDAYQDSRASTLAMMGRALGVGSWTTTDLSLQYDLGFAKKWRSPQRMTLALSAINVFDKDPPFIVSADGLHYDGVNASPRGRFVSAQITASW